MPEPKLNINLIKHSENKSPKQPKYKDWEEQTLSEKVETIFHLIGTKEGWDKIKADYADGKLNGVISQTRRGGFY